MDTEKIIFILIAIGLSIFSMYRKAKKQKQIPHENEESSYDLPQEETFYDLPKPVVIFQQQSAPDLLKKSHNPTKKSQKQLQLQNIEASKLPMKNVQNFSQSTDFENETALLENFEGTELQKAFLYSEIFKSTKS
jgi:hypothetical protein